jgi:pimeloyl-ACP methyl ester carboxylesterase
MLRAQAQLSRSLLDGSLDAMSQRIPEVARPTLILWGAHDAWLPVAQGQRFAREISGSTLHVLDCCGHMPQEESPDEVADLILEFLRATAPATAPSSSLAQVR